MTDQDLVGKLHKKSTYVTNVTFASVMTSAVVCFALVVIFKVAPYWFQAFPAIIQFVGLFWYFSINRKIGQAYQRIAELRR